jgi:putative drug exporter of the RND superfamily
VIGLEHAIPIVSFVPLLLFAILFGLSMDYEVFLLHDQRGRGDEIEAPDPSGDPNSFTTGSPFSTKLVNTHTWASPSRSPSTQRW